MLFVSVTRIPSLFACFAYFAFAFFYKRRQLVESLVCNLRQAKDMWDKEYTAYIIQCSNGKLEWEVTRRYHDFSDMEAKIRSSDPYPFKYRSRDINIPLPPLPPKHLFGRYVRAYFRPIKKFARLTHVVFQLE